MRTTEPAGDWTSLGDLSMTKQVPFLGIDFGTSQSSMSWFNPRTCQAEIIRNAEGEDKTPSVVYYGDGEVVVGKLAEDLIQDEQERRSVLSGIKRRLAESALILAWSSQYPAGRRGHRDSPQAQGGR